MSGGSMDYVYQRVDDAAAMVSSRAQTIQQKAFAAHLVKVAKALHDLEWVWSCDYGPGDEVAAIAAVLQEGAELEVAEREARWAFEQLREQLDRADVARAALAGPAPAQGGPRA